MKITLDNIFPVEYQLLIERMDKKTDAGIVLSGKKDKFFKGVVKKIGGKCKFRKEKDVVYVLKAKSQQLSVGDFFLADERDAILDE